MSNHELMAFVPSGPSHQRRSRWRLPGLLFVLAWSLVGCNLLGPRTIRQARFNYNEALAASAEEQFLLNLVRLRYGHAPYFLQVGSVTTQYSLEASARWQWIIGFEDTSDEETTLGAGIGFSERPTITYLPLQGEDLARTLLRPLAVDTLFLLAGAGWDTDAVFHACVSRIGHVRNTPEMSDAFSHIVELLEQFALDAGVLIDVDHASGAVELHPSEDARDRAPFDELRGLLGGDPASPFLRFTPHLFRQDGEIGISLRSPLAIMNALARNIDVPTEDLETTQRADSSASESTLNRFFQVHSNTARPADAYVSVRYRDNWFYIDPKDYRSKATFAMLSHVFSLQASRGSLLAPIQTLSVGN